MRLFFGELSPSAHREIGDGVEVGAQHFGILEELVSEGVEPVQGDEEVSCCHPFLETSGGKNTNIGGDEDQQRERDLGNHLRESPTSWKWNEGEPAGGGSVWDAATQGGRWGGRGA